MSQKILVTHPLRYAADPAELVAFTELGAYVEFCSGPLSGELRQMLAVNPRAFLGLELDQADSPPLKES